MTSDSILAKFERKKSFAERAAAAAAVRKAEEAKFRRGKGEEVK